MYAKRAPLFVLFVGLILCGFAAYAQDSCTVSLASGSPDVNGIVTYHVHAQSNNPCCCNTDELDILNVWLDAADDNHSLGGSPTVNCLFVKQCDYDKTLDTYCWAPLTPHHFITGCSAYCGADPPAVNPNGSFSTGSPTPPGLSISYDPAHGLTRTWAFVTGHAGSTTVYIDNVFYSGGAVNSDTGTSTGSPILSPCGGDHVLTVYANTCGAQPGATYWNTRKDLKVPDPGDPSVSITFDLSSGSPIGKVTYGFPAAGSRNVKVWKKAKPPYTLFDTLITDYDPPDLENTINFTPASSSGDEIYEATAISGNCNPVHEAKDAASLDNTSCPFQPPAGPPPPKSIGGPIRLTTGNMHYADAEPLPQVLVPLARTYDSANTAVGAFGTGWTSLLDAGLVVTGTGNDQSVVINTEENRPYIFFIRNGAYIQIWPKDAKTPAVLGGSPGSFTLRESGSDLVRTFNSTGRLTALTSLRQQRSLSVSYDGNGHPTQIADSWGTVTLLLTTDPTSGLVTRIDVGGRSDIFWTYQYSSNRLISVTAPDSHQWRQYQYTTGLLATILDPLGNVIESHAYDASGRAISSIQATNDITSIAYNLAGRNSSETLTQVTYASGRVSSFYSRSAGSSVLTADVFDGCASCSSENGTFVYDTAGHVTRSQDARGYVTDSSYVLGYLSSTRGPLKPSACDPQTDSNHCRMTVEDLTTASVVATPLTVTTKLRLRGCDVAR